MNPLVMLAAWVIFVVVIVWLLYWSDARMNAAFPTDPAEPAAKRRIAARRKPTGETE